MKKEILCNYDRNERNYRYKIQLRKCVNDFDDELFEVVTIKDYEIKTLMAVRDYTTAKCYYKKVLMINI